MVGGVSAMILMAASSAPPAPPHDIRCVEVVRPLSRGAYPVEADLKSTPCPIADQTEPAIERVFWYDRRSGVLRVSRDLAPRTVVAAPPHSLLAAFRPGDSLAIETRVGPVVVQRDVAVVRPARAGKPIVVQTAGQAPFAIAPAGSSQ